MTRRRFTMIELVMAMAILGILTTVFVGQFRMLKQMRIAFTQENRCLIVMDNVVERLAASGPEVTTSEAEAALADEFDRAQIPRKSELRHVVTWQGDTLVLAILRPNDRPAARIEVVP